MTNKSNNVPWTERHRPKKLNQVVGNEKAIAKILNWLNRWNSTIQNKEKRQKRAVLLYGSPGTGKTVVVEAIANERGYLLVETNASDFRTPKKINRWISRSIEYKTLDNTLQRRRIILFDEIDGISGRGDKGGIGAIIQIIKNAKCPVFLTANNIYQPKLRTLRSYCLEVNFKKLGEGTITSYLNKICEKEGLDVDREAILLIAKNANGDLRGAINDLQAICEKNTCLTAEDIILYPRNEQLQTFDALQKFFAAKTWFDARRSLEEAAIDYEIMMLCIHESLPYQFKNVHDLTNAYNLLSRANWFLKKAQKERTWQLMRYFFDLMTGIPFLRKYGKPSNYVIFSKMLVKMSRSKAQRRIRRELGFLIGKKCHVSSSKAIREIVPYLNVIFSLDHIKAAKLSKWFELKEKMIEYLSYDNASQIIRLIQ